MTTTHAPAFDPTRLWTDGAAEPIQLANLIGGAWKPPASGEYTDDRNPARPAEIVARFPRSGVADVRQAIEAAASAAPDWKRYSAVRRGQIPTRVSRLLDERKEALARLMTREQGKPLAEARGEIGRAVEFWAWMGQQGGALQGITAPTEADTVQAMTLREPLGVVALITPWNFPVNIPAWKLASALVCGNTVVLKPSSQTPVCAAFLAAVLTGAGLPAGVLNVVFGGGGAVGEELATHPLVAGVSFTGSTATGLHLNQLAATHGKPVQAEMGGHNAVIVLADADLDRAARGIVAAAFGTSGQRCTAARRVLADQSIVEPLTAKIVELTRQLHPGPGDRDGNDIGPLIDENALTEVREHIERAKAEGAVLVCGGERPGGDLAEGYYLEPTVLGAVHPDMTIANEEVFGPVLPILAVDGYENAIAIANASRYGLSAALYTRDVATVFRFMHEADAGGVHINKPPIGGESHLPFGGVKQSAIGPKEMGAAADFFTRTKTVYVDWT